MIDPETLAAENGFSHWAQMNMAAAVPLAEVRDMCAADRCGRYGHNWACRAVYLCTTLDFPLC